MENLKILRKLELGEKIVNGIPVAPNTIRTMRLRSQIDLYAHLDQLKSAFHTWKKAQKLLRAKVVHCDDDYYFAIDENSSANKNLENVHFLRINSKLEPELNKLLVHDGLVIELMVEKCASEVINFDKNPELLWQFFVIEMNNDKKDGVYVYEMIWHITHMIADGVCMKENLLLLLDIIYRSIEFKSIDIPDFGFYAGTSKIFERELSAGPNYLENTPKIFKPSFLDRERARKSAQTIYDRYFESKSDEQLDFQLFDLNSGKCFETLLGLIRISRETSNLKRKKFDVPAPVFEKVLKRCKSEKTKLTSVLNVIASVSMFRLFKKHGSKLDYFFNFIPVDLRKFRANSVIGSIQLGNCVGGFLTIILNQFDDLIDESDEFVCKFWQVAREKTIEFEDRIKNDNTMFFPPNFPLEEVKEELFDHMALSNTGVVDDSSYSCFSTNDGPFRIENMYTVCNFIDPIGTFLIASYFCSVDKKLCCSFANNSYFFDHDFVDEFVNTFKELINFLFN